MRFPFVSRDTLADTIALWADLHAAARADAADARHEYQELLDKYHALKLQGATIPEPVVTRSAKEVDPLTQAVLNASAGKPPQVRAMMMKQLNEDRNNPLLEEMDILRRIESGFASDDEGLPE